MARRDAASRRWPISLLRRTLDTLAFGVPGATNIVAG